MENDIYLFSIDINRLRRIANWISMYYEFFYPKLMLEIKIDFSNADFGFNI